MCRIWYAAGYGVGKRGREGRLGETVIAQGLSVVVDEVGGGAHIFVDRTEQEDKQEL